MTSGASATSGASDTGAASNGDIQAVSRTAQILTLFGPETPEVTVAEAAERLGLNRTTLHRYFVSLEAAGLLERTEERNSVFTPAGCSCSWARSRSAAGRSSSWPRRTCAT